jgi:uncharacterized protein (DUF1697 family)
MATKTWIAFLRAVNLGPVNKVPMAGLRTMVESLGYDNVRTHLQSGNVIFTSGAISASKLEEQLRAQLVAEFKVDSPVLVRTSQQLAKVVKENPFIKKGNDPKELHVAFLSKKPAAKEVAAIDAEKSLPDEFAFGDRAIYMRLVNGVQGSRLPNWDRLLSVDATGRTWKTVTRLQELAEAL